MYLPSSIAAVALLSTAVVAKDDDPQPEKWQQLSPIVPQCGPMEPGCSTFQDSFAQFFDPWWSAIHAAKHKSAIKRFTGVSDRRSKSEASGSLYSSSAAMRDANKASAVKSISTSKNAIRSKRLAPVGDMTLNYVLPNSKVQDACNITMYDGKGCRGKIVWRKYFCPST